MNKNIFNEKTMRIVALFSRNINAACYGRDLSRKLKLNQRTIQLQLNALEKEKMLISKIRGKLKEFLLNKDNILAKELLISAEIYKFYRVILENFELREIISDMLTITDGVIIIFGSFAKGYASKKSDLDILFIGKINKEKLKQIQDKYSRKIHFIETSEKGFLKGLKNKANFILEITENHIICQGFEKFTNWRYRYGSD